MHTIESQNKCCHYNIFCQVLPKKRLISSYPCRGLACKEPTKSPRNIKQLPWQQLLPVVVQKVNPLQFRLRQTYPDNLVNIYAQVFNVKHLQNWKNVFANKNKVSQRV